jgi:cytochrome oxidase Cu insertion factor (SCO1/SenC/PrrC family)
VLKGTDDVNQKYMVRLIPSMFLVDKQGNIKKQYMGGGNDDELEQGIKALL